MELNKMTRSRFLLLVIFLGIGIILLNSSIASAATMEIPGWLKSTAKYWSEDAISDEEFVNVIQWLINEDIVTVPQQDGTSTIVNEDSAPGVFSSTRCELGYQYVKMTGRYTNGNESYSVLSLKMAVLDVNGDILATGSGLLTNVEANTNKFFDAIAVFSGTEFDSCEIEVSSALPKYRLLENNNARPIIIEVLKEKVEDKDKKTIDELLTEMKEEISEETSVVPEKTDETSDSNMIAGSINKIQSGLVISIPLDNEMLNKDQFEESNDLWVLGGSAQDLQTPYDYFMDTDGIHIGVQSPESGTYVGSFALLPPTEGTLFHSSITSPQRSIPNDYLQNGLFVRGSEGPNNYLTCNAVTNQDGTSWSVTYSYEDSNGDSQFDFLFEDYDQNAPLSRDCTIVTNGYDLLRVFLDESEVFTSYEMNMNMKSPLMSSLSTQSSHDGKTLYGVFSDFYITLDTIIQINNLPPSADRVLLLDSSDNEIASGIVKNGLSIVDVGKFSLPLTATVRAMVEDDPIASTSGPISIYGGDIYEIDFTN